MTTRAPAVLTTITENICHFAGSEGQQPGDGGGSGEKWGDLDQEGRCWSGKWSPCVLLEI